MPHLLWASLDPLSRLSCNGVILAPTLGSDRANRSQRSESHWTRQKCSGARANTLPPWPSVDGPPLFPTKSLLPLSEMSTQTRWRGKCGKPPNTPNKPQRGNVSFKKSTSHAPPVLLSSSDVMRHVVKLKVQSQHLLMQSWPNRIYWSESLSVELSFFNILK